MELDCEAILRELEIEVNEFVAWCKRVRNDVINSNSSDKELQGINNIGFSKGKESCQIVSANNSNSKAQQDVQSVRSIIQEGGENDFS